MSKQLRALVGARVSVVSGPQKVSHLAQLETATKWAELNGCQIVGEFEDLGVSASVRPEDRPDLGQWLTEEGATRWDVIVWSKMDRAFRSTRHCVDFAQWAEEHRKVVVFAEDGLKLDYRPGVAKGIDSMMAELFVYLGSFFAQLELNRFKTRALDGHRVLRQTDRWAAGAPPLGFKVVDHPSGRGKGLDTDPEGKRLLHDMAGKLLAGWSFVRISDWLSSTPRPLSVTNVVDALTSPRTQGLKMHKKQVVLDGDGEPIRLAPPTFDADAWGQIQEAALQRKLKQRTPTKTSNPVLGIAVCGCTGCPACNVTEGICGASLSQQFSHRKGQSHEYRYYRCGRTPKSCSGINTKADDVDFQLLSEYAYRRGDEPATRRVFVPGEDHSAELEQVNATIDRLRLESDSGLLTTPEDNRLWLERMKAQVAKRDQLAAMPSRAAGWVTEETGQTKHEALLAVADEDRRQLYLDAGIRFVLCRKTDRKRGYFDSR